MISIKNPYVEYYFKEMGDIGYLCEDYNEMKEIILRILENHSNIEYQRKQKNILSGRKKYLLLQQVRN
ncbi:hypothetical protein [Methanobacterium ferruginis]|uniref:hypothetical protein n=1 Tax=Methanobacterium ferruginis TaxID=710191 RepID=UPI002573AA16|nr:hypothetical protein [Methanobacterium ferruginis]